MLILPSVFDIIAKIFPKIQSYQGSWWFYLLFSLILYYIAITGYTNAVSTKIGFKVSVFDAKPILFLNTFSEIETTEDAIEIDYEDVSNDKIEEIKLWKNQIEALIQSQRLYENPELSLTDVARKLQTNTSIISKTINQGFDMNFNDFINNYRIEAVKKMFANGEHKKSTLLGIAYDCGFNSKATFNRAFKKNTNLSPKEYLNTI
jgi:AraC-like DNA-binding protein